MLVFLQVCYIAIYSPDKIVAVILQLFDIEFRAISFIYANIEIIYYFFHRTTGYSTKLNVLLMVPTAVPFGNIIRY